MAATNGNGSSSNGNGRAPRTVGRKSLLTAKLRTDLCAHLKQGQPHHAAAALVGIHRDTLARWKRRGKAARALADEGLDVPKVEQPYLELLTDLEYAWDYGEGYLMDMALKAARGEIKGRATDFVMLLERTRPEGWRRRSSSEYVDRDKSKPVPKVDVAKLDREERAHLRALLQKARHDEHGT